MDIIFEIILEFILNELIEASRDKNNSKLKTFPPYHSVCVPRTGYPGTVIKAISPGFINTEGK